MVLSVGLWFIGFWFLVLAPAWAIEVAVTGEDYWRLVPALLIPALLTVLVVRTLMLETVYLSNLDLKRQGFVKTHTMRWRDVTGTRWMERRAKRGREIRLLVVEGQGGQELLVAPTQVQDPGGVLRWAIEQAQAGEPADIAARVRREGRLPRRWRPYLVHGLVALVLCTAAGVVLVPTAVGRQAERTLRTLDDWPPEERITRATEVAQTTFLPEHLACRAWSRTVRAQARLGGLEETLRRCERVAELGCRAPFDGCRDLETLSRAETALTDGDGTRALREVDSLDGCLGGLCVSARVRALRLSGADPLAEALAGECRERFGARVFELEFLSPCRP